MKDEDVKVGMRVRLIDDRGCCGKAPIGWEGTVTHANDHTPRLCQIEDGVTTIEVFAHRFELVGEASSKLHVGDKVRVLKATVCCTEWSVGKELTVVEDLGKRNGSDVHAWRLSDHLIHYESGLEKIVEDEKMSVENAYKVLLEASGIKVGDRVKVLRAAKDNEMGWRNSWARSMNRTIGEVGIVTNVVGSSIAVKFDDPINDYWHYPFFVLEVVSSGPASLRDVPKEVLVSVRDKWQRILDRGYFDRSQDWSPCAMCSYVYGIRNGNHCYEVCPLAADRWCTSQTVDSRIANGYNGTWSEDVAAFICMLNVELARRS